PLPPARPRGAARGTRRCARRRAPPDVLLRQPERMHDEGRGLPGPVLPVPVTPPHLPGRGQCPARIAEPRPPHPLPAHRRLGTDRGVPGPRRMAIPRRRAGRRRGRRPGGTPRENVASEGQAPGLALLAPAPPLSELPRLRPRTPADLLAR